MRAAGLLVALSLLAPATPQTFLLNITKLLADGPWVSTNNPGDAWPQSLNLAEIAAFASPLAINASAGPVQAGTRSTRATCSCNLLVITKPPITLSLRVIRGLTAL
jgi:hypothetical protein